MSGTHGLNEELEAEASTSCGTECVSVVHVL